MLLEEFDAAKVLAATLPGHMRKRKLGDRAAAAAQVLSQSYDLGAELQAMTLVLSHKPSNQHPSHIDTGLFWMDMPQALRASLDYRAQG